MNKSSNWSTMNSNKSSKIKPLWECGCDGWLCSSWICKNFSSDIGFSKYCFHICCDVHMGWFFHWPCACFLLLNIANGKFYLTNVLYSVHQFFNMTYRFKSKCVTYRFKSKRVMHGLGCTLEYQWIKFFQTGHQQLEIKARVIIYKWWTEQETAKKWKHINSSIGSLVIIVHISTITKYNLMFFVPLIKQHSW